MTVHIHQGDLPDGLSFGAAVAVDSETMGLKAAAAIDLCVVQLSAGDGDCPPGCGCSNGRAYDAPNLKRLLADPAILKIFHFPRFDIGMFDLNLGVETRPVYCTKTASRLCRTYTDRHGLKDLVRELLGQDMSKAQQSSDWGAAALTPEQQAYAASDVLSLHALKAKLDAMLEREGRMVLAQACFAFLPVRAQLDLAGWEDVDIFAHS